MRATAARLLLVLTALLTALPTHPASAASPAPTAASAPGLQIQLLDAPLAAQQDPRANMYIVDQVTPGQLVTRHVRVTNTSTSAGDISMYTAAASVSGGRYLFADGHAQNDLSSWTSLSARQQTLAAGKPIELTVTIAIPRDATRGERYAVIWAERASAPIAGGAREVNRVGVRMYLDVNSSAVEQPSNFAITTITARRDPDGRPRLSAAVRNTGSRTLDVSGAVTLTNGPAQTSVAPVSVATPVTIAPGETHAVEVLFDPRLAAGPWLATVALSSGLIHRSASANVSFTAAPVAAAATPTSPVSPPSRTGQVMWIAAAIVVAALAVLIWVAIRRRIAHPVSS